MIDFAWKLLKGCFFVSLILTAIGVLYLTQCVFPLFN